MDFAARVRSELNGSGYKTQIFRIPQGTTVAFEYTPEYGSRKGETIGVGVSGPDGEYPEYPRTGCTCRRRSATRKAAPTAFIRIRRATNGWR